MRTAAKTALTVELDPTRFYAHGDEAEHATGTFHCHRCKGFHPMGHFRHSLRPACLDAAGFEVDGELVDNAWHLAQSLRMLDAFRYLGRSLRRHDGCASILTAGEKKDAADLLAQWRANPNTMKQK